MKTTLLALALLVAAGLVGCDVGSDPNDQRTVLPGQEARGLTLRPDLGTVAPRDGDPAARRDGVAAPPGGPSGASPSGIGVRKTQTERLLQSFDLSR